MDSVARSASGVGVLDKAVAILGALEAHGPGSLGDLVAATGLTRPTAHRLAAALEVHGLVGRDERGRYALGPQLTVWGRAATASGPIAELAAPVLTALRDETGESAQLYVRDGDARVCVAVAERPAGLRDTVPIGARLPLTAGSGASVLLAWAPDARLLPGADAEHLARVRRRGWAASVAEREAGVASVSAPVLDGRGDVVAAISVSGPIDRLGRAPGRRYAPAVVRAARGLSERLP